jgi:hypothetical protein
MTSYRLVASLPGPKLQAVNMDWPPPPPSPLDEIERLKRRVKDRARFLKLMKERFPRLPY